MNTFLMCCFYLFKKNKVTYANLKENRARDAKAYFTKSEDADTQKEKSRTTQRYFEVFVHNFTVCIFILEFEGLPSLCLLPVCLLSARLICLSSICPPSIQHAYLLSRDAPFYPVCPSSIQYARLLSSRPPSIPPPPYNCPPF